MKRAQVIFVGTVSEVRELGDHFILVFEVEESLKGTAARTLEVRGPKHTCGFGFGAQKGDRYMIFAGGSPLGTSAVSGNQRAPDEQLVGRVRTLLAPPKK